MNACAIFVQGVIAMKPEDERSNCQYFWAH
jgi:hypothetical protein